MLEIAIILLIECFKIYRLLSDFEKADIVLFPLNLFMWVCSIIMIFIVCFPLCVAIQYTLYSSSFVQKVFAQELAKIELERDWYKSECENKDRKIQEYHGILAKYKGQLETTREELGQAQLVSNFSLICYT